MRYRTYPAQGAPCCCAPVPASSDTFLGKGKAVYDRTCVACHQADGKRVAEVFQLLVNSYFFPAQPRDNKLTVLMISLNPTQDTPATLAKLGESHHLDKKVFRLSISDNDAHTRAIASALGVKYRVLGGGEINHSTRIVLLDATGRIIASSTQLGAKPDQDFLKQIRAALKPS